VRVCKHCHVRVEKVTNSSAVHASRNGWGILANEGDGFTGWVHKFSSGPDGFTLYAYCDLLRPVAEPQGGDQ
jgi:hypothetical protein